MQTDDFILGCLTDNQVISIALYTGLNRWGIRLRTDEIAKVLNLDPKTIHTNIKTAQKRLLILQKQGYL